MFPKTLKKTAPSACNEINFFFFLVFLMAGPEGADPEQSFGVCGKGSDRNSFIRFSRACHTHLHKGTSVMWPSLGGAPSYRANYSSELSLSPQEGFLPAAWTLSKSYGPSEGILVQLPAVSHRFTPTPQLVIPLHTRDPSGLSPALPRHRWSS